MTHADGMLALNSFNPNSDGTSPPTRVLISRRRDTFGDGVPLFYRDPVHFVSASGVWVRDQDGFDYLDAYNNVPSVGHCHPHVIEAVSRQVATLNTRTRYLLDVVTSYAERLLGTFPRDLSKVLFTSSGTESVDLAMRLARLHTGGTGFIVTRFAYHGHSTAVAEITPAFGPGVPLGANVRLVDAPDGYRRPGPVAPRFARDVAAAIADLERHGIVFAGLVLDTVCSSDGPFVDPPGFLQDVVSVVKGAGGVFIADEVQPYRRRHVGFRAARRVARHRSDGQANGQRDAHRRRGDEPRCHAGLYRPLRLFQYLRREHGLLRGSVGSA
jgi:4-aminobutyrate aminotransferase-like enzyme